MVSRIPVQSRCCSTTLSGWLNLEVRFLLGSGFAKIWIHQPIGGYRAFPAGKADFASSDEANPKINVSSVLAVFAGRFFPSFVRVMGCFV